MRAWPIWLILCLALAGCDGAAATGGAGSGGEPATVAVAPPASVTAGSLALYPKLDDDEVKLRVGAQNGAVVGLFPSPVKGIVTTPLPKGFSPEEYTATGWELGDSTEGAGYISNARTKEIVAAIIRKSADDATEAQKVVDAYGAKTPGIVPVSRTYGANTYTFWEEGDNRLMILESPGKKGAVQLTLVLGVKEVLNFLRADPDHARIDAGKLLLPAATTKSASSGS